MTMFPNDFQIFELAGKERLTKICQCPGSCHEMGKKNLLDLHLFPFN